MSMRDELKNIMFEAAKEEIEDIKERMKEAASKGEQSVEVSTLSKACRVWMEGEGIVYFYREYSQNWMLSWE